MQTPIPIDLFALGRLPLLPGQQIPLGTTPGVLTFADILQGLVADTGSPEGAVDALSAILAEHPVSSDTAVEDLFALHEALSEAVLADGALAGLSLPLQPLFDAATTVQQAVEEALPTTGDSGTTNTVVAQIFQAVIQTVTTEAHATFAIPADVADVPTDATTASIPVPAGAGPETAPRLAVTILDRVLRESAIPLTPEQRVETEAAITRLVHQLRSAPTDTQGASTPLPRIAHLDVPPPTPAEPRPLHTALQTAVTPQTAQAQPTQVDAQAIRDGVTVPELLNTLGLSSVEVAKGTPQSSTPLPNVSFEAFTAQAFAQDVELTASNGTRTVIATLEQRIASLRSARLAIEGRNPIETPPASQAETRPPTVEALLTTFGHVLGSRSASIGAGASAPVASAPTTLATLPDQIVQQAQFLAAKDGGIAQLQLQPPALGRLTVQVMQDHDVVTIELRAQSQQVREALQGQLDHLKQQFSDQGLELAELTVHVDAGEQQGTAEDREAFAAFRERFGRPTDAARAGPSPPPIEPTVAAPADTGRLNLIA